MIETTDETIEIELDNVGDDLVLVDVWANWCGPCRMYTPVLNTFSEKTGVKILAVDADTNPETMQKYDIRSIPTTLVFLNGNVVDTLIGARPYAKLVQDLAKWS